MKRIVGPDGNDVFENDTIGGVPAFVYMDIASRLHTQRGREPFNPEYGTDFPSCLETDNPSDSVRSEVIRALEDVPYTEVSTSINSETNTINVEISGDGESGNWTMAFGINREDGSIADFPQSTVDGRHRN